ncbi:transcriptional regulator BetI [Commensalibacter nepenthis]|uniref:HTH-type transcriptional regulator BetI n=1 Tax=Commensalibacter nepenthis TaxID=3043872 RepID=A0ABT6QA31_9PROT|nr:transcriptional regulator BetI [Commensalibacter sp. TBRC 10068]MDI2113617.1 transcriptional regulator BetI [Commensalibacter sp. TBRC 10068]
MKKNRYEPESIRTKQILDATVNVIHEVGVANTTLAKIAQKADLSTGILSHYFGNKQGLLNACMRDMLRNLHSIGKAKRKNVTHPVEIIKTIIDSNFDISQVNNKAIRVWLEFWNSSMHEPELHRLQRVNEKRLYSNLKYQFQQIIPLEQAVIAARGMASLIDGLWLRGSLMSVHVQFDILQAREIAYQYLDMQIRLYKIKKEDPHE